MSTFKAIGMLTDRDKAQARDDIATLQGDPPHNTMSNICWGDGYYAASLERRYGMSISELKKACSYPDQQGRIKEIAAILDEDIDTSDIPEQGEEFFERAKSRRKVNLG